MSGNIPVLKMGFSFIALCSILFAASAENIISLCGTVKNGEGAVIAAAKVSLRSDTTLQSNTNSSGEFIISNTAIVNSNKMYRNQVLDLEIIGLKNNELIVCLHSPARDGVLDIFLSNGRKSISVPLDKMQPGEQNINLPKLANGFYLLHFTINRHTFTCKMLYTNDRIFLSNHTEASQLIQKPSIVGATGPVDTLLITKDGFKPEKIPVWNYQQNDIEIIMDRTRSLSISVKDMPSIKEMPAPLTMNDGTKVTSVEQWQTRRREMIRTLEDYEYGHMPPPPGNVSGTIATASTRITSGKVEADYRMIHLSFGPDHKLGFDLGIFTPVSSPDTKGYPVLISLDFSAGKSSLGASSAAISRGYAVATIAYQQLGADAPNYRSTAFFPSYPEYDWRDFSAWAWGISRAVDYLVTDSLIDKEKIMATGTSRNSQAVLLAGAIDDRIALSAPVAGGMAFRFSGKEMGGGQGQGITEIVDQNTYWFGPLFEKFRNQTPKLPCDQHWLLALTAPRLFIMCNSLADPYGRAYAAVQTYLAAKPVYQFLQAEEYIGVNFREGGHGMTSEDWDALLDFADQKLLKKAGNRRFDIIPPEEKLK